MRDLTAQATQASRRARLVEQVLLDRVAERAADEHKRAEPKGLPVATIVLVKDLPPGGALIAGRPIHGLAGQLALVDAGHAQVLVDAGYALVRDPLTVPPAQKPEIAAELRSIAEELQAAADEFDPREG